MRIYDCSLQLPIRLHFVFTLEIFVSKVGRPVRCNFEIHSGYKLTCEGSVIFILKERIWDGSAGSLPNKRLQSISIILNVHIPQQGCFTQGNLKIFQH